MIISTNLLRAIKRTGKVMPSLLATLLLCGCLSPQALQPVAVQNRKNVEALNRNALTAVALLEPCFAAIGETLIIQRITQVRNQLIDVVGVLPGNAPANWPAAFAGKGTQGLYDEVKALLPISKTDEEKALLRQKYGWIYNSVADRAFTPTEAAQLVARIASLTPFQALDSTAYYRLVEKELIKFDPTLSDLRDQVTAAAAIVGQLKTELEKEASIADQHSRSIVTFAEANVDLGQAISGTLGDENVKKALTDLANSKLKNEKVRTGALDLLNQLSNSK